MKTLVLLGICKVVQDLQKIQLKDLDISSLDSYYTAVRDAENMKVNVQWLRSRLDEIKDAINLSGEAKGLINERDRRVRTLIERRNNSRCVKMIWRGLNMKFKILKSSWLERRDGRRVE